MTYVTLLALALLVLGLAFAPGLCWRASWESREDDRAVGEAAFVRSMLWLLFASLVGLLYMLVSAQVLTPVVFGLIVAVMVAATAGPAVWRVSKGDELRAVFDTIRNWLGRKVGSSDE